MRAERCDPDLSRAEPARRKCCPSSVFAFVRKEPPKGQSRHDSLWSFLSTQLHQRHSGMTTPNNHPPRALIWSEGVSAVVLRAAAGATCCHFCFLKVTEDNVFSTLMTRQTGCILFVHVDSVAWSSAVRLLCIKYGLKGDSTEQNREESCYYSKRGRDQVALLETGDRTEALMVSSLRDQQNCSSESHCFMPQNQVTAKTFKVLNVNFMVMTDSAARTGVLIAAAHRHTGGNKEDPVLKMSLRSKADEACWI